MSGPVDARNVVEAMSEVDAWLLRAIALLTVEAKPGLEVDAEMVAEARDLVVDAYRTFNLTLKDATVSLLADAEDAANGRSGTKVTP